MTADLSWLDELEKAHAAATPGPWTQRQDFIDQGVPDNSKTLNGPDGSYLGTVALSYRGEDNAALIVAAVNALPELVARIRAGLALADELDGWPAARIMSPHDAANRLRAALTPPTAHTTDQEQP